MPRASSILARELTQALASCRENEQESIVRIVEELTHMIRLFRVT